MDSSSPIKKQILIVLYILCIGFFGYIVHIEHPQLINFYESTEAEKDSQLPLWSSIYFPQDEEVQTFKPAKPSQRFHWKSELDSKKAVGSTFNSEAIPLGDQYILKGVGSNQITLQNTDDRNIWSLLLSTESIDFNDQIVAENFIFLRVNDLQVLAIDVSSGKLLWQTHFNFNEIISLHSAQDRLIMVISADDDKTNSEAFQRLVEVDTTTGALLQTSPIIGFLQNYDLHFHDDESIYGVNNKNYFFIWNMNDNKIENRTLLQERSIGPVTYVGDFVFFTTAENSELYKFNTKELEMEWTQPVRFKVDSQPYYVDQHNMILAIGKKGVLQAFDAKSGESQWRLNLRNENILNRPSLVRFGAKGIMKFELGWRYKGYVLAIPCRSGKICIVNPRKGQMLSTLDFHLSKIVSPPIFNKSWAWSLGKDEEAEELQLVKIIEPKAKTN